MKRTELHTTLMNLKNTECKKPETNKDIAQSFLSIQGELVPGPAMSNKIQGCSNPTDGPPHLKFHICVFIKDCAVLHLLKEMFINGPED